MRKDSPDEQVQLLLRILEKVSKEEIFALKGGTAINLFHRDMPRLSVDIDLTYLPLQARDVSLNQISEGLGRIAAGVQKSISGSKIQFDKVAPQKRIRKFVVHHNGTHVKLEPNEILRGSLYPPEKRDISKKAEERFGIFLTTRTLSGADLYGGKICAALDRQHPRDLFDIKILFENEGLTNSIRKAFVVYLASHDRPMNELINPSRKNIQDLYERELVGLTISPITLKELEEAREMLISKINSDLNNEERLFLISMKQGSPEWHLMGIDGLEKLPALQWKLRNIQKMGKSKQRKYLQELKTKLNI